MSGNKKEKKVAIIKSTKQIKEITIVTNDVQNNIFTRELLLDNIKNKRYKKVVFITGAGISVAAGSFICLFY